MARVKFSSIVSEVAGSIGSATFQNSAYGVSLRNKPHISKARLSRLGAFQSNLGVVVSAWASLSLQEQRAWSNYNAYKRFSAANNKSSLLSGYAIFTQYNLLRVNNELSILLQPSFTSVVANLMSFTLQVDELAMIIWLSESVSPSDYFFAVYAKPLTGNATRLRKKNHVFIKSLLIDEYIVSIGESWRSIFGSFPEVGDTIELELWVYSLNAPIGNMFFKGQLVVT